MNKNILICQGAVLVSLRLSHNLSRSKFVIETGINMTRTFRIESRIGMITIDEILKINELYNCNLAELIKQELKNYE